MATPVSPNPNTGASAPAGPEPVDPMAGKELGGIGIVKDWLQSKIDVRNYNKLRELESVHQAYMNLGAVAAGETIEVDAIRMPHQEASGIVTRAIHKRREREIGRDSVTLKQTSAERRQFYGIHPYDPKYQTSSSGGVADLKKLAEKRRAMIEDAKIQAEEEDKSPEQVLAERKGTITKADHDFEHKVLQGEYLRPMKSVERKIEAERLDKQYKAGELNRVDYQRLLNELPNKMIIDIPYESAGKYASKAVWGEAKYAAGIRKKTETGLAAKQRLRRIKHLRKKLDMSGEDITPQYPEAVPSAPEVTPPPKTPEELRTEEVRDIIQRSAIAASGWITRGDGRHEIPIKYETGVSLTHIDDFKELGEDQALRVAAGFDRTPPEILEQYLQAGIPELITVIDFGETLSMGQIKPNSAKKREPLIRISYETTNRGAVTGHVDDYPYTVETKDNAEFRMHFFLAQSDAERLLDFMSVDSNVIHDAVDIGMRDRFEASENWDNRGLRPPYERWARTNARNARKLTPVNSMAIRYYKVLEGIPINSQSMPLVMRDAYGIGISGESPVTKLSWGIDVKKDLPYRP